jgi:Spy/CpxP family protein refolding chaperone
MKKVIVLVLALWFAASSSFAAGQGGKDGSKGQRGSGDRAARMQKELGLSDEQMQQMRSIRENGGSREEMRAVLNDEQRAIVEERRAKRQGQGKGGKGTGHGQGHPAESDTQNIEPDEG